MSEMTGQENKTGKELERLIAYSLNRLIQSKELKYPEISVPIINYMQEYCKEISNEQADTLFKPICWYLSDKRILDFVQTGAHGAPNYWKLNKKKAGNIKRIIEGIFKTYGETLQARFDIIKPGK